LYSQFAKGLLRHPHPGTGCQRRQKFFLNRFTESFRFFVQFLDRSVKLGNFLIVDRKVLLFGKASELFELADFNPLVLELLFHGFGLAAQLFFAGLDSGNVDQWRQGLDDGLKLSRQSPASIAAGPLARLELRLRRQKAVASLCAHPQAPVPCPVTGPPFSSGVENSGNGPLVLRQALTHQVHGVERCFIQFLQLVTQGIALLLQLLHLCFIGICHHLRLNVLTKFLPRFSG